MTNCYDCNAPDAFIDPGHGKLICAGCAYSVAEYNRNEYPVTEWEYPKDGVFMGLICEMEGGVVAEIYDYDMAKRIRKALILLEETERAQASEEN